MPRRSLQTAVCVTAAQAGALSTGDVQAIIDSDQPIVTRFALAAPMSQMAGLRVPAPPCLAAGTDTAPLTADPTNGSSPPLDGLQALVDAPSGCDEPANICSLPRE